jgi:hypothetical protein
MLKRLPRAGLICRWRANVYMRTSEVLPVQCYVRPTILKLQEGEQIREKEKLGRARAQADNRWLPTAAARVRARVLSIGICGGLGKWRWG